MKFKKENFLFTCFSSPEPDNGSLYTEQKKELYTYMFSHISANTNPRNIIFISNKSEFNSQQTCVNETGM